MIDPTGKAATLHPAFGHPAPSPECTNTSNVDTSFQTRLKEKQKKPKRTKRSDRDTLTLPYVLKLPVTGKTYLARCGTQPGFFVQVTSKGFKSWGVEAKVKGGAQRTVIIGPVADGKGVKITDAQKQARKLHTDATVLGIDIAKASQTPEELTLDEAQEQFLNFPRTQPLSEATKVQYGCRLEHLKETLPRGSIWKYTEDHIEKAYKKVVERCAATARAKVTTNVNAPGTANAYLVMIHLQTLWNFHNRKRKHPACPTSVLEDVLKPPKRRKVFIEDHQFSLWWNAWTQIPMGNRLESTVAVYALYFRMLALVGLRRTELRVLKWSEVLGLDTNKPWIFIPGTRTKNHEDHKFPIGPWLTKQLREHKKTQPEGTEWVFAYPVGTYCAGLPLSHASMTRVIDKHRKLINWKWNAHDTRRTHVTAATKAGAPGQVQSKLVNHKENSQTSQYDQTTVEMMRPWQAKIEAEMLKLARAK